MAKSIKFRNDTYLDSSSVVHNKNKLSDILSYSTNEIPIGKYYDGKTIYKKTIKSTYTEKQENFTLLSNISTLVKGYGYCKGSGGTKQFVPMPNAFLQLNSSNQIVLNASNMISIEYEITLEYTKLKD